MNDLNRDLRPGSWLRGAFPGAVLAGLGALAVVPAILQRIGATGDVVHLLAAFVPLHGVAVGVLVMAAFRRAPRGGLAALDLTPRSTQPMPLRLLRAALVVLLFLPFSIALSALSIVVLQQIGVDVSPSPLFDYLGAGNPALFATVLIGVVLVAPLAEEILFRLAMYDYLNLLGLPAPALCVAIVFSVIHGQLFAIPALFTLSLVLQAARTMSRDLYPPIFIHAFYNLFSILLHLALANG